MSARAVAISLLAKVDERAGFIGLSLDAALKEHPLLEARDAAFVTELGYGVVRHRLTLDEAIRRGSQRSLNRVDSVVMAALRVGAYQLLVLSTPPHAAVAATVDALVELKFARAKGFVNAVLRRIAEASARANARSEAIPSFEQESAAAPAPSTARELYGHPEWMVKRWLRHFGKPRTEALLAANNVRPPLTLRVNATRRTRDEVYQYLKDAGIEVCRTRVSPVGLRLSQAGRPANIPGYAAGDWQIQDEAAQLVSLYAEASPGARVLDVCAAPGTKSSHLAETCDVVALDIDARKLAKVMVEAERLGVSSRIQTVAADATKPLPDELGEFDVVLVDAPCSGLGTLRRHPELKHRRTEDDIHRLSRIQRAILGNAHSRVKPGGVLVYSVCTLEPEEGLDHFEQFLRAHPEFSPEVPRQPIVGLPLWQGWLRTIPGDDEWDGFFAARLRKSLDATD